MRLGLAVRLDMRRHLVVGAVELLDRRLLEDLHPLLLEGLLREGRNLGVLDRKDAVHHLDHRRLGAEGVVEAGEFDADGARADDKKLLRHVRRLKRVLVGPDPLAVCLEPRQFARPGAGGDDDVLRLKLFGALVGLDADLALRGQGRLAHDDLDLVLLHQVAHARGKLLGHPARPLHHRVEVIADALGLQPELLGAVHQVEDLGGPQHRLRRDAAPVEADAAHVLALDDAGLQAKLRCANGGDIPARARPDHDDVEGPGCHWLSSRGEKSGV